MSVVRITYLRHGRYLTKRVIHAPAGMSETRARAAVFGFNRRLDRVELSPFIFDAVQKILPAPIKHDAEALRMSPKEIN